MPTTHTYRALIYMNHAAYKDHANNDLQARESAHHVVHMSRASTGMDRTQHPADSYHSC